MTDLGRYLGTLLVAQATETQTTALSPERRFTSALMHCGVMKRSKAAPKAIS